MKQVEIIKKILSKSTKPLKVKDIYDIALKEYFDELKDFKAYKS
jgi:hypothetical protein